MTPPVSRERLASIAREAAALVRAMTAARLEVESKHDGSPVTEVDRAVDAFLREELGRAAPSAGWLSEETEDDRERLSRAFVWIVDPIDGTKQLISGLPEVAISIGGVAGGAVVAAAVVNPMTGQSGSWVAGEPPVFEGLSPRPAPDALSAVEAIVSRTEHGAGSLAPLEGIVARTIPVGSVAYKLLRVASRSDPLTFSLLPKHEWDVCGGAGLIAGAGLAYLRLDGAPLLFNRPDPRIAAGTVAGPRALAEHARDAILLRLPLAGAPVRPPDRTGP